MRPTVFASFATVDEAEKALGALLDHGVIPNDVSVVFPETYKYGDSPTATVQAITTTTAGDAAVGAVKGAGVGLGVGALAAIASLVIPGFGLVVGGGALAVAVAGAAATTAAGAIAGGVTGYLKDQGVPGEVTERYSKTITAGGALVGVSTPSNNITGNEVREILIKYNGRDVHSVDMPPSTAAVSIDQPIEEREPIVVNTATGERTE